MVFSIELDIRTKNPKRQGFKKFEFVSYDDGVHYVGRVSGKRIVFFADVSDLIRRFLNKKMDGTLWVKATAL